MRDLLLRLSVNHIPDATKNVATNSVDSGRKSVDEKEKLSE